jgi:hypothetical protein
LWNCWNSSRGATLGFDIPAFVVTVFPFGVAVAIVGCLVWKYPVGFLNELLEMGS